VGRGTLELDDTLTLRELTPSNIRAAVGAGDNLLVAFVNPTLPHSARVHHALHELNAHVARVGGAAAAGFSVAFADCHAHRVLLKWYGVPEVPSLAFFPRTYPRNYIPVPYRDNKTSADYLVDVEALVAPTRGLDILPPPIVDAVRSLVPDLAATDATRVRATLASRAAAVSAGGAVAPVSAAADSSSSSGGGGSTEHRDPRVAALRAAVSSHLARQRAALTAALAAQERVGDALLQLADALEVEGVKGLARRSNEHQVELSDGNALLTASARDAFIAELAVLQQLVALAA